MLDMLTETPKMTKKIIKFAVPCGKKKNHETAVGKCEKHAPQSSATLSNREVAYRVSLLYLGR